MKKFKIFFLIISVCSNLYSQDVEKTETSGEWIVTADIGFSTLEAKDNFKATATIEGAFFGKEFIIGSDTSIVTGLGVENVRTDFSNESNQQVFLKNSYVNLPLSLRLFYDRPERVSLFADLGIYGTYLLKAKSQILSDDIEDSENGLGFNFGVQGALGAKYKFKNEKYSMSFGIRAKNDFISSYKSSAQEFKTKDAYFFQIGLGLIL
ncbi:MAG: outer membrane beta-barrel protein [Gelidibacter sp.]